MSRKAKTPPPEEQGSSLEWLLTFSDVLTLMITFFVLLISMSSMDTKKLKETSAFFRGAVGNLEGSKGRSTRRLVNPRANRPGQRTLDAAVSGAKYGLSEDPSSSNNLDVVLRQAARLAKQLQSKLLTATGDHPLDAAVVELLAGAKPAKLVRSRTGGHVSLHLGLLFVHARPELRPEVRRWLGQLRKSLGGTFDRIEVPTREAGESARLASPWHLAAWRASALALALRHHDSPGASVRESVNRSYARIVWSRGLPSQPPIPITPVSPESSHGR